MIEDTIIAYLNTELSPLQAYAEVPVDAPAKYIVIDKTGSGIDNRINSAKVAIQSYADSLYEAAALNEQVKTAMLDITSLDKVSACDLDTDYNFTDTTKKKYRYQAVFDLVYYD